MNIPCYNCNLTVMTTLKPTTKKVCIVCPNCNVSIKTTRPEENSVEANHTATSFLDKLRIFIFGA